MTRFLSNNFCIINSIGFTFMFILPIRLTIREVSFAKRVHLQTRKRLPQYEVDLGRLLS